MGLWLRAKTSAKTTRSPTTTKGATTTNTTTTIGTLCIRRIMTALYLAADLASTATATFVLICGMSC